jgi:hypothetical protein
MLFFVQYHYYSKYWGNEYQKFNLKKNMLLKYFCYGNGGCVAFKRPCVAGGRQVTLKHVVMYWISIYAICVHCVNCLRRSLKYNKSL